VYNIYRFIYNEPVAKVSQLVVYLCEIYLIARYQNKFIKPSKSYIILL